MDLDELGSSVTPARPDDRERWEAERAFREREVAVQEREQTTKESELARWSSPLIVAIIAAAVAAIGSSLTGYLSASDQRALESERAEQARILEVVKTGDPDKAADNLQFLLDAGLISDSVLRQKLATYLASRPLGKGFALPAPSGAADLISKYEPLSLKPYRDALGKIKIGYSHTLSQDELTSGRIDIKGESILFSNGISSSQADALLEEDLKALQKKLMPLIRVRLSQAQLDSLTDFAWNVGLRNFEQSSVLKSVNSRDFTKVGEQLRRWTMENRRVLPSLVKRREDEARVWGNR